MKFSVSVIVFIFLIMPIQQAQAQLVACTGANDCNFCTLSKTVDNILEWVIAIMVLVAVMLFMYAGFKLVTSAGKPGAMNEAKGVLVNVIIGFIIMLAAWTIVDTILKAFAGDEYQNGLGVWNDIECGGLKPVNTEPFDASGVFVEGTGFVDDVIEGDGYDPLYDADGGYIPSNLASSLNSVSEHAGEICYITGCIPAVSLSNSGYPLCGFNVTQFIDTKQYGNSKVSSYFTLNQVAAPREQYVYIDPQLPVILDELRRILGKDFTVTSGYRSPAYNSELSKTNDGVASCSRHMSGLAVDIIPPDGISQAQVAAACDSLGARYTNPDYRVHTHCDWGHLTGQAIGIVDPNQAGPQ